MESYLWRTVLALCRPATKAEADNALQGAWCTHSLSQCKSSLPGKLEPLLYVKFSSSIQTV